MSFKKRLGAVLGLLLICMVCFSGCKIGSRTIFFATSCSRNDVFKIGSLKCKKPEAKLYLANYKNLYGNVNGTSLWTDSYDTKQMEDSIKDAVVEHLTKVYSLVQYAEDHEISLNQEEKDAVKEAGKAYYESLNKAERNYIGASKKEIIAMYERYALAEKVYSQLMGSVDEEVSEDEARVMEAMVFYVTDETLSASLSSRLKKGESFETIANSYNEGSGKIKVSFGRHTYPDAVEEKAFRLDNDEFEVNISDGEGKYYFVYCINKFDEELSEENKKNVISNRQTIVVEEIVSDLDERYYSDFNTKTWEKITIDTNPDIQTNSFFSTLDEYLKF